MSGADGVFNAIAGEARSPKLPKSRGFTLPFLKSFNNNDLHDGKAIGFKGKILGSRFAFNVGTGPEINLNTPFHQDNISLHVLYQAGKGFLVSSLVDNQWGDQKKVDNNTVQVGEEVYIRAEPHDGYWKVVVNGEALCEYRYSIPLKENTHIFIEGDLDLDHVKFEGGAYMVPFEYPLKDFNPGKLIWISGKTYEDPEKIDVEFYKGDDIAFKFQARFKEGFVVRNTRENGKYGKDETDSGFPFAKNSEFTLEFDLVDDCFEVYVNNKGFVRYFHRMDPHGMTRFELKGDVELKNIDVQSI